MIVALPASLMAQSKMAQSTGSAILHSGGGVWLNHNLAPSSSAIFPNDLIQTAKDAQAKIDADGSTVTVQPDTVVEFDGDELVLDHGSLQVVTSRALRVRVNCVTVTPVELGWTRYDVTDVDGKVHVAANQDDVKIHYAGAAAQHSKQATLSDATVHQGEQATREERCGAAAIGLGRRRDAFCGRPTSRRSSAVRTAVRTEKARGQSSCRLQHADSNQKFDIRWPKRTAWNGLRPGSRCPSVSRRLACGSLG